MGVTGTDEVEVDVIPTLDQRGFVLRWLRRGRSPRPTVLGVHDSEDAAILVFLLPFNADGFAADQGGEIGGRFLAVGLVLLRCVDAVEPNLVFDVAIGDDVDGVAIRNAGTLANDDFGFLGFLLPRFDNRLVDLRINRIGYARRARTEPNPRLPRSVAAMDRHRRGRNRRQCSNRQRQQTAAPKPTQ